MDRGSDSRLTPAAPVVLVPKGAVTVENGQSTVWVVTAGTATRRPVQLGANRLDLVEVTSGVLAGDTLILNPPAGLVDHAPVRVKGT